MMYILADRQIVYEMCKEYYDTLNTKILERLLFLFERNVNNLYYTLTKCSVSKNDYYIPDFLYCMRDDKSKSLTDTVKYVHKAVTSLWTDEEIYNILMLVLIQTFHKAGRLMKKSPYISYYSATFAKDCAAYFKKYIKKWNPIGNAYMYGSLLETINPVKNEDSYSIFDYISKEIDISSPDNHYLLKSRLSLLEPYELKILVLYYEHKMTDNLISKEMSTTRQNIMDTRLKALDKLCVREFNVNQCCSNCGVMIIEERQGRKSKYCIECKDKEKEPVI